MTVEEELQDSKKTVLKLTKDNQLQFELLNMLCADAQQKEHSNK